MAQRRNSSQKCLNTSRRKLDDRPLVTWENLPDDVLISILMPLSIVDYFAFGKVCQSWRSVAVTQKETVITAKLPFSVIISSYAKRSCSFLDIFERRRYKTMVSDLAHKSCLGFTCGYLVMLEGDFKGIYVLGCNSRIGELILSSYPCVKQLPDKPIRNCFPFSILHLVSSSEKLFMVEYSQQDKVVYELDSTRMEWTRTENLGGNAGFLGNMKCSEVFDATKWGGEGKLPVYTSVTDEHIPCAQVFLD